MYDIEESDNAKSVKLIESAQYIQSIEPTNELKQKGKYFMITTKTDYRKAVREVNSMVKYIYPNQPDREIQTNERHPSLSIHNNVSSYSQSLMHIREANPAPTDLFN